MRWFLAQQLPALDVIGGTIAGAVVLLFIGGWVWAKPAVDTLIRAGDKKDDELAALRQSIEDRVIPVVEENTELANRVAVLLEQHRQTDKLMLDALDELRELRRREG